MLTERAFELQTRKSYIAIKHMHYLQGLPCSIYYPITKPTLYNDSSQDYTYNSSSDIDDRYLVTGIFDIQSMTVFGLDGYSSFEDDEILIYTWGEENLTIPRNSKVEVFYQGSLKVFRTQGKKIANGLDGEPVYGIISLVPMA